MKTRLSWSSLILAVCVSGCALSSSAPTVNGSGKIVSETRTVANFDKVSVGGSGELVIIQEDEESLVIRTDDNLLPFIKSHVSGGELSIGWNNANLSPSQTIHYELKVKNLGAIQLSGSLQAKAEQLKGEHLSVAISGSGKVSFARLETKELDVQVSGSGEFELSGHVNAQKIGISGAGKYAAGDLQSERVEANVSGSGNLTVWATGSLSSHISGSGEVNYYGTPSVQSETSGSGRVRSLGAKQS
jgi:hypothetical protein